MTTSSSASSARAVLHRRRPARGVLGTLALGLAVVAAPSCRQVLDIQERTLAADAADGGAETQRSSVTMKCGGFRQATSACGACMDQKCCAAAKDCAADPMCQPTYGCIRNCVDGDAECVSWCLGSYAHPDTLATLISCGSEKCSAACKLECGDLHEGTNECDACARGKCCDEVTACASDADCAAFDYCLQRCLPNGSDACSADCKSQHPSGANLYAARTACVTSSCTDECSAGHAWSCLEHPRPSFKPPSLDDIVIEMNVVEYIDASPFANLGVKACAADDVDCVHPRGTATTDENGHFSMSVRTSTTGFDGYLDFTPPGDTPSDLFPALYYFRPALLVGLQGLLRIPSVRTFGLLVGAMQIEADPARGHIALVPTNCGLFPTEGVSVSVDTADDRSTRYYFSNGAPSPTPTETESEPSIGGYINLPPGIAHVRATTKPAGGTEDKTSAEMNFIIRPGTLTTTPLPPNK